MAGQINYSAAKAGIIGLTKAAAKETARYGLRVNAIQPGLIRSPMTTAMPEHVWEQKMAEIPMSRAGGTGRSRECGADPGVGSVLLSDGHDARGHRRAIHVTGWEPHTVRIEEYLDPAPIAALQALLDTRDINPIITPELTDRTSLATWAILGEERWVADPDLDRTIILLNALGFAALSGAILAAWYRRKIPTVLGIAASMVLTLCCWRRYADLYDRDRDAA